MQAIDRSTLDAIAAWAGKHEEVRRVWVVGSRASGAAGRDDDLDLALEIAPAAEGSDTIAEWMAHDEQWRAELQASVRPRVDLQWVDADIGNGAVRAAADEGKVLAYERH